MSFQEMEGTPQTPITMVTDDNSINKRTTDGATAGMGRTNDSLASPTQQEQPIIKSTNASSTDNDTLRRETFHQRAPEDMNQEYNRARHRDENHRMLNTLFLQTFGFTPCTSNDNFHEEQEIAPNPAFVDPGDLHQLPEPARAELLEYEARIRQLPELSESTRHALTTLIRSSMRVKKRIAVARHISEITDNNIQQKTTSPTPMEYLEHHMRVIDQDGHKHPSHPAHYLPEASIHSQKENITRRVQHDMLRKLTKHGNKYPEATQDELQRTLEDMQPIDFAIPTQLDILSLHDTQEYFNNPVHSDHPYGRMQRTQRHSGMTTCRTPTPGKSRRCFFK
jgi:hypothetical protein